MRAFEALLELLDVHPQLPGGAPLTVRATPRCRNVFTRTEAVSALHVVVGMRYTREKSGGAPS